MKTLIFDDSTQNFILSLFDKTTDKDGYIIEKKNLKRVLTPAGDEVHISDFAGFTPGSEIVLTKDLPSLLEYANN